MTDKEKYVEDFKKMCIGILAESNNCMESQKAFKEAKSVPEAVTAWMHYFAGVVDEVPRQVAAAGDNAHILSTGDNAHIAVTGDDAFVNCLGKNTVISIIGKGCVVTAKDWKNVTFVGVHADLEQLSAMGYTSVTSFNPNSSGSDNWRFMNDGKVEENKG